MRPYDEKRDFTKTPEPSFLPSEASPSSPLRFVVQQHNAERAGLHYDLRLEAAGALKSWAVPKGPSLDPAHKRQAIMVEDHPIEYAEFEGMIPRGQYGGGEVILWDEGSYMPMGGTGQRATDEPLVLQGLKEGKLSFIALGHRMQGEFTLVRKDNTSTWLLLKKKDAYASTTVDLTHHQTSVRTGLTSEDLRAGRTAPAGLRSADFPTDVLPLVPGEMDRPFSNDNWVFEPKLDGIRVLALKDGDSIRLMTRNQKDVADRFPRIVRAIAALPDRQIILDGELTLNDETGRSSFQHLMDVYQRNRDDSGVAYWVFDLLYRGGNDLRSMALKDRKAQLETVALNPPICPMATFGGDGVTLFEQARKLGMEGIVGKRLSSKYRGGPQPDDWVKIKGFHTEEFLVGGFTPGQGGRERHFGALLVGRKEESGKLAYCGNVGGGFSDDQLDAVRKELETRTVPDSPFSGPVESKGKPTFVRPDLVAEVRFMAWTREGRLRFPVFQRLRYDVTPPLASSKPIVSHDQLLAALEEKGENLTLVVDGQEIRATSLNKQLWPGITKRDLMRYFIKVSPHFLDHFRGRPLTFVRYPEGITGESFYQRHFDKGLPEFVQTVDVYSEGTQGSKRLLLIENLATMLWLAQIAAIELHPWHSSIEEGEDMSTEAAFEKSALNHPDYLACDLDPNIRSGNEKEGDEPELNDLGWARTVDVALALRDLLKTLGLRGYPKTTGKTGIHVFIPVERIYDHDQIREAARTFAAFLEKKHPALVTTEYRLAKRPDKVFFDAGMNGKTKTLAGAFSPRPVVGGRVSFPLRWEELEKAHPEDFTISTVPDIVAARGDAWADIGRDRQRLG